MYHDIGVATFIRHLTVLMDRLSGFNGSTISVCPLCLEGNDAGPLSPRLIVIWLANGAKDGTLVVVRQPFSSGVNMAPQPLSQTATANIGVRDTNHSGPWCVTAYPLYNEARLLVRMRCEYRLCWHSFVTRLLPNPRGLHACFEVTPEVRLPT